MSGQTFTFRLVTLGMSCLLISLAGCHMMADGQNIEGVRLLEQGQAQAALQRFQQVVVANPTNADGYYNMAATYHRVGREASDQQQLKYAEDLYNRCLDISPNHVECRRGLAVLLAETNRSDRAFNLLKNWVDSNPTLADARVELARLYQEYGEVETAKAQLNQAIAFDQNNYRAWAALGRIREELGDPAQALANYQRSYGLNSFQPRVAQRIASLSQTTTSLDVTIPDSRIVTAPTARR